MTPTSPRSLVERIVAIAKALDDAGLPWAFGGAFALAYATEEPRGTRDIDVNVFVPASRAADVFGSLPDGVRHGDADIAAAVAADQVRLWWDDTPIDLFFAAEGFHHEVAARCRDVPFEGRVVHILNGEDLAVFKAMFDRPKDWVDIETMVEDRGVDLGVAADRLATLMPGDERVERLRGLGGRT